MIIINIEPEDDTVIVKPMYNWFTRTKGALGVYFTLFGTSFLLVNSHLTREYKISDTSFTSDTHHFILSIFIIFKNINSRLNGLFSKRRENDEKM